MKDSIRFSLTLFLICLVSAGLLSWVFSIAEPKIIEQKRQEEKRAIEEVLPRGVEEIEKIQEEDLIFYKAKDKAGNLVAYVFIAEGVGYSDDIRTTVAITSQGRIIAVKILEHRETPGIGSQILEDEFLNQFKNKDISDDFDAITGATTSSSAVIDSIKEKADEVLNYGR